VQACPQGYYNEAEGAESTDDCAICKPGYYCFGTTSSGPTGQCFEGFVCEEGTIYPEDSDANAFAVTAGHYAPLGSSQELECPRGTYQDQAEQASCKSCEAGYYCDTTGMTTLTGNECPVGYYCESYDDLDIAGEYYEKKPCPPGTYRATAGATSEDDCTLCPDGKYCENPG